MSDAQSGNYIFSTEGHPIPVGHPLMRRGAPQCRAGDDRLPTQRFQQASGASMGARTGAGEASTSVKEEEMSGEAAAVTSPAAEQGTEGGAASEGGMLGERGDIGGHGAGARGSGELLGVSEQGEEPQCREAVSARREHRLPLYWGWLHSNASALDALVCPDFTQVLSSSQKVFWLPAATSLEQMSRGFHFLEPSPFIDNERLSKYTTQYGMYGQGTCVLSIA